MGTTLTGKRVQNTYDSLLKLSNNDNLTGTAQIVTDGLGNDSPIYLSTTRVGIGVSPTYEFQTNSHAKIGGNLIVGGNLTVNGTTTIVDSTVVAIGDNMIEMAKDNVANTMDIGWYGTIVESGTKFIGMKYDAGSGVTTPEFHIGLGTVEPSSTAEWTVKGKLVIGDLSANGGDFTDTVYIDDHLEIENSSGYGYIELGGSSGGYIDLKGPFSNDFDLRILTGGTNSQINAISGALDITANSGIDLQYQGSNKLTVISTGVDITGNLFVSGGFKDSDEELGTSGQVLSSTGTGTNWVDFEADSTRRVTITVKNTETVALSAGTVVHAHPTAPVPSGNLVQVKKADYDTASLMPAIGILNEDLDASGGTNDEGEAIMFGFINGIDTSSFSAGDELYVGNDGSLVNTKPTATTQQVQKIAVVMKVDATNGSIEVFGAGRSNDVPNLIERSVAFDDGNLSFGDNDRIIFGDNQDFNIHSNGVNTFLSNLNNNLVIQNSADDLDIIFRSDNGDGTSVSNYLVIDGSTGGVNLYHYGTKKFETTSSGVTITGTSIHTGIEIESTRPQILFDETDVTANWRNRVSGGSWRVQYAPDGSSFSDQFVVGASNATFETDATFAGDVILENTKKLYFDGQGDTYIFHPSADKLSFRVGGQEFMRFTEDTSDTVAIYKETTFLGDAIFDQQVEIEGAAPSLTFTDSDAAEDNYKIIVNSSKWRVYNVTDASTAFEVQGDNDAKFYSNLEVAGDIDLTGSITQTGTSLNTFSGNIEIDATSPQLTFRSDDTNISGSIQWLDGLANEEAFIGGGANMSISSKGTMTFSTDKGTADNTAIVIDTDHHTTFHGNAIIDNGTVQTTFKNQNSFNNIYFGDANDAEQGQITFNHNTNNLYFNTGASNVAFSIDSGGSAEFAYDLRVYGAFKDSSGDTGTSGQILSSTGTGTNWVDFVDGSGTANKIPLWTDSDTLGDSVIFQDGTDIGIGISSADYKLDVGGAIGLSGRLHIDTVGDEYKIGADDYTTDQTGGVMIRPADNVNPTDGDSLFTVRSGGGSPRLFVEHSGTTGTTNLTFTVGATSTRGNGNVVLNSTGDSYLSGGGLSITGNLTLADGAQRNIIGPTNQTLGIFARPNSSTEGIKFSTDGGTTTEMFIQDGGDIGINTDDPQAKLEVKQNGNNTRFNSADANGSYITFANNGTSKGFIGSAYHLFTPTPTDGDDLGIRAQNELIFSAGGATEKMRITNNGDIGINEPNPLGNLHIEGGQAHNRIYLTTTSNAGTGYDVEINMLKIETNSEVRLNMGTNGNPDSEQIRSYQSNIYFRTNDNDRVDIDSNGRLRLVENLRIDNTTTSNTAFSVGGVGEIEVDYPGIGAGRFKIDNDGNVSLPRGNLDISSGDIQWTNGEITSDDNNTSARIIARAINNPANDECIFAVESSGSATRFGVTQGNGGFFRDELRIGYTFDTGSVGTPSYDLDVSGDIRATDDIVAFSDIRVKENIITIDSALDKVNKLRGVEYNKIGQSKRSIGVIAQEIEKVLPEVVSEDAGGMKSVAYGNITGVLIEAIKELSAKVEALENKKCNCNCK